MSKGLSHRRLNLTRRKVVPEKCRTQSRLEDPDTMIRNYVRSRLKRKEEVARPKPQPSPQQRSFEDGGRREKAKVKVCTRVSPREPADVTGLFAQPTRVTRREKPARLGFDTVLDNPYSSIPRYSRSVSLRRILLLRRLLRVLFHSDFRSVS